jgi:hypothetical protein
MELPIIAPAPVVIEHAGIFRDLFENQCQFRHFQHYLTGLRVLPNTSMAHIARCILGSADKTNLSRFFSEAPWREDEVNRRRIRVLLHQTKPHRRRRRESLLALDDTLCEHMGSLFDYVDRHYNHSDGTYPLAHNPVTSVYVSGPVRFPLGLRLYRRYEELTQWEAAVAKHFPDQKIPTDRKARNRLHQQVDPVLLQDPEFRARHERSNRLKRPSGPRARLAWSCSMRGTWQRAWCRSWPGGGRTGSACSKPTACWKRPAFTSGIPMAGP